MMDYLPQEVMVQILLKLPAKTLLRCLAVCKLWKSIIHNPSFINAHLHHQRGDLLLVRTCPEGRERELYSLHCDDEAFIEHAKYEFPFCHPSATCYRVVGSCNGVICLTADQYSIIHDTYLWNPTIQKCVKLPLPRVMFHSHGGFDHELGFGFDPKTNDYKVVRIVDLLDVDDAPFEVDIYSLGSGVWRNISHLASGCSFQIFERGSVEREHQVYLNGAVHWVGYDREHCIIIAFHLGDEAFHCFETPSSVDYIKQLRPVVIQESLSLLQHRQHKCSIWMMKTYGSSNSWVKQVDVNLTNVVDRVIGLRKKGELLVEIQGGLYSFDPDAAKGKELNFLDKMELSFWKLFKEGRAEGFYFGEHVHNYDPEAAPRELGLRSKTGHWFEYAFHSERYTESLVLLGMMSSAELVLVESEGGQSKLPEETIRVLAFMAHLRYMAQTAGLQL